jgi:hypothetical protein
MFTTITTDLGQRTPNLLGDAKKCTVVTVDDLRLHLLDRHHNPNGVLLADLEAQLLHEQLHTEGVDHSTDDLPWDEAACRQAVADIPAELGRDAVDNAFADVFRAADPTGW